MSVSVICPGGFRADIFRSPGGFRAESALPDPTRRVGSYVLRQASVWSVVFVFGEFDHHLKSLTREKMMIGATR